MAVWTQLELHPYRYLLFLYLSCVAIFLASAKLPHVDGQLTGSDGAYYYSYLPSILIDHDLNFTNQYELLIPPSAQKHIRYSPEGRPHNKHAIGPALLWAPFFLIGHCIALALKAAGAPVTTDGMGYVYQIPTLVGSLTYGFAALLLMRRSCRRFVSPAGSTFATIVIWLATNVIYYMVAEPSMSHTCSLFATALFLHLWLSFRPFPTPRQWVLLGISGALIALVRQPDATWLALPAIDMLLSAKAVGRLDYRRSITGLVVFGITAVLAFSPQLFIWRLLNGSAVRSGYGYTDRGSMFSWLDPKVGDVLFSFGHGLYLWHPVLFLATAGLFLLYRKNKGLILSFTLIFLSQVYVIGSWYGWTGGHSFGSRMLINTFPLLALGLGSLVDWAISKRALLAVWILSAGLILWNALFCVQYRFGYISKMHSITFYELTAGKFLMLKDIASRLQSGRGSLPAPGSSND